MRFTVTSTKGSNQVVLLTDKYGDTSAEITFNVMSKKEKFEEDFTITTIKNLSTNSTYTIDKALTTGDSKWSTTREISIPSDKIGQSVSFEIYYFKNSAPTDERKTSASIYVVAPQPKLTVEATIITEDIIPASTVQLKYEVKNIGNVPVSNILIADETITSITENENNAENEDTDLDTEDDTLENEDTVKKEIFTEDPYLSVGGTITKDISVKLDGKLTLKPTVTYVYNGKTYTEEGNPVEVSSEEVEPSVSLTCNSYIVSEKGANHPFTYTIKNTTKVPILNLRIYKSDSENAELVEEIEILEVDQEITGIYEASVEKSGIYKFKIVYTYDGADGDISKTYKTDKSLKLPNEVSVEIIKTTPENLKEPGEVTFTLLIENSTANEIRDITISEDAGLFSKISLDSIVVSGLKNGTAGSYTYNVKVNIPKDRTTVLFSVKYSINGEYSTINLPYEVHFIRVTDQLNESPTPTQTTSNNNGNDKNPLLIIIACIFMLIVLALIVVLIILKNKKSVSAGTPSTVRRKVGVGFNYDDDYDYDDYDDDDDSAKIEDLDEDLDEEYGKEFDEELDDEGVKIYKGRKH
jgi:hypothetical protein